MMTYDYQECSDRELPSIESKWQKEGFVGTTKNNERDLLPKESIKAFYRDTEKPEEEQIRWLLCRRLT